MTKNTRLVVSSSKRATLNDLWLALVNRETARVAGGGFIIRFDIAGMTESLEYGSDVANTPDDLVKTCERKVAMLASFGLAPDIQIWMDEEERLLRESRRKFSDLFVGPVERARVDAIGLARIHDPDFDRIVLGLLSDDLHHCDPLIDGIRDGWTMSLRAVLINLLGLRRMKMACIPEITSTPRRDEPLSYVTNVPECLTLEEAISLTSPEVVVETLKKRALVDPSAPATIDNIRRDGLHVIVEREDLAL